MNVNGIYKATNLDECYNYLNQLQSPVLIHGGTDVIVQLREELVVAADLIDISTLNELKKIYIDDNTLYIGAGVTITELQNCNMFPDNLQGFVKALKEVGSVQIRNAATIGGNLCNGSPAADTTPILLALDATLVIGCKQGKREVALNRFFLEKGKVDIKKNEILECVYFSFPKAKYYLNFYKYAPRNALSITLGSIAALISLENNTIQDLKIGSGGFSANCIREVELEKLFINKHIDDLEKEFQIAKQIILKRVIDFDRDFQIMKEITIVGALKHTLRRV